MKQGKASIIIRTKDEDRWIKSCLEKVFAQNYKSFEVVLVDNNSKDNTLEIIKNFPVKLVQYNEKFFPGKALNMGIEASDGEYIVCISGHCIPKQNTWLSQLISNFSDDKVAGIYGRQEPLPYSSDSNKRDLWTVFGLDKKIQLKDTFFHNANSVLKREIWEKFKFDEEITNIEDRIWGKQVINSGYKIIYEPEASVYHWHGIHQDNNEQRLRNVVRIVEEMNLINDQKSNTQSGDKVLAIIPFRGKDEEIDGFSFLKKTIQDAVASESISEIIVNCDDEETSEKALNFGANHSLIRSKDLNESFLGINTILKESLDFADPFGEKFNRVLFLSSTYPFRTSDLLDKIIHEFDSGSHDTLVPVLKEYSSVLKQDKDNFLFLDEGFIPKKHKQPLFIAKNGLGLITKPKFISEEKVVGNKISVFEIEDAKQAEEIKDKNEFKTS